MRHTAKPGLSGLAQVNGRNAIKWEDKLNWDLKYIENVTLLKDFSIILKTVKTAFIKQEGITDGDMATAEDFGDYLLKNEKITSEEYDKKQIEATYYEGEGFAGTIIDAFAAGLPVIASDWKYNSEIIKQGITGVITKTHSISELKNAILSINSDVEKWNFMRKNCISEAKMYLPANAMKKLIDIVNG